MLPAQLPRVALPQDAVEVARVLDAWGVKGWFKLQPHSASPEALFSAQTWYLQPTERGKAQFDGTLALSGLSLKPHADLLVASSTDIPDRNAAEALKGARVFVSRADFPPPDEGEYYWVDLVGLAVVNREGVALGTVSQLLATGPQTTLVLGYEEDGRTRERMIPFVDAFVDEVDVPGGRITVDWQPDY